MYSTLVKVFFVFIDGIGIGENDPEKNPFSRYARSIFKPLSGTENEIQDLFIVPTDATLGIPGLPQSATGQTALWTGFNGPAIQGHHLTGFPGPTLARVIHEHSIIKKMQENGYQATLINAYSQEYLEKLALNPRLTSASTHVQIAAGIPPLTLDDLEAGNAIFMDVTHEALHQIAPNYAHRFPVINARQRGHDFVQMARSYDLTLFEFFLTDKAGHDGDWKMASWAIRTLEGFLGGVMEKMDAENELLILSSDHGNMEDFSTESHTLNPVPTILYGAGAGRMAEEIRQITDIPLAIYDLFGIGTEYMAKMESEMVSRSNVQSKTPSSSSE